MIRIGFARRSDARFWRSTPFIGSNGHTQIPLLMMVSCRRQGHYATRSSLTRRPEHPSTSPLGRRVCSAPVPTRNSEAPKLLKALDLRLGFSINAGVASAGGSGKLPFWNKSKERARHSSAEVTVSCKCKDGKPYLEMWLFIIYTRYLR